MDEDTSPGPWSAQADMIFDATGREIALVHRTETNTASISRAIADTNLIASAWDLRNRVRELEEELLKASRDSELAMLKMLS